MTLWREIHNPIPNIYNILIALDFTIKVLKADEAIKRWKTGIAILHKRDLEPRVLPWQWKYAPCDLFLRVQYWCQVLITSLLYLQRYNWFFVLLPYWNHSWRHQLSNLHNLKSWISLEREKTLKKGKHHSSPIWKAF